MSTLLTLPTELLLPILHHALSPLPTSLAIVRSLSLSHPRLYTLTLHLLKQTLASYEAVGTNQLLPHPYSRKDENGEVMYQDFAGMKEGMKRIVEWRWVRGRLPVVIAKMEKGMSEGGFLWEKGGGGGGEVEEYRENEVVGGLSGRVAGLELDDRDVEVMETAEDREARRKLTAWLLGKTCTP